MNCTPDTPCQDCDNSKLIRRLTERMGQIAAERDILLAAVKKAMDAPNEDAAFNIITAAIAQVSR